MNEEELNQLLVSINNQLVKKDKEGWFKFMVATFSVFIITTIFAAGVLWSDIKYIKENQIPKTRFESTETKVDVVYSKVFNVPIGSVPRSGK